MLNAEPFTAKLFNWNVHPLETVSHDYNKAQYVFLATAAYFKTDTVL